MYCITILFFMNIYVYIIVIIITYFRTSLGGGAYLPIPLPLLPIHIIMLCLFVKNYIWLLNKKDTQKKYRFLNIHLHNHCHICKNIMFFWLCSIDNPDITAAVWSVYMWVRTFNCTPFGWFIFHVLLLLENSPNISDLKHLTFGTCTASNRRNCDWIVYISILDPWKRIPCYWFFILIFLCVIFYKFIFCCNKIIYSIPYTY